ncbi:S-layer homology domain-containing protein [Chakrabartyella piscis]|uniref:S-layer homology domain-containing protein n=1 Tax=Chakrabartyella piscis TaxID=2918914 RepID=UPI0029586E2D|nr:S-layer homology domain-containing protein [Chakrabartyella piscis]
MNKNKFMALFLSLILSMNIGITSIFASESIEGETIAPTQVTEEIYEQVETVEIVEEQSEQMEEVTTDEFEESNQDEVEKVPEENLEEESISQEEESFELLLEETITEAVTILEDDVLCTITDGCCLENGHSTSCLHEVTTGSEFAEAISSINQSEASSHIISVLNDITLVGASLILKDNETTILGNGNTVNTNGQTIGIEGDDECVTIHLGSEDGDSLTFDGTGTLERFLSIDGADAVAHMYDGVTIQNMVSTSGRLGCVFDVEGGSLYMHGGVIQDNQLYSYIGYHGAVSVNNGVFEMTGGIIQNTTCHSWDSAYIGGAILALNSDIIIDGGTISDNGDDHVKYGGGIFWSGDENNELKIANATFMGNYAIYLGDAIYISGDGVIAIENSQFYNHNSTCAIVAKSENISMTNETMITENSGGIFLLGSDTKLLVDDTISIQNNGYDGVIGDIIMQYSDQEIVLNTTRTLENQDSAQMGILLNAELDVDEYTDMTVGFSVHEDSVVEESVLLENDNITKYFFSDHKDWFIKEDADTLSLARIQVDYVTNMEEIIIDSSWTAPMALLTEPDIADVDGQYLAGWYTESDFINQWNFETTRTMDTEKEDILTLYAKWEDTPTSSGGGSSSSATYYYIEVIVTGMGVVEPDGGADHMEKVKKYNDITFAFIPEDGYVLSEILVDGISVDLEDSYEFENVITGHTLEVVFISEDDSDTEEIEVEDTPTLALDRENHFAYMVGYPDDTFAPDHNITRAETVAMFARLLTEKMYENTVYPSSFIDITGDEWYANAVGYMEQFGIVSGYENNTFRGSQSITRAEFAAIASRFDELEESEGNYFNDVLETHWAIQYINSAAEKGWINGYPDGTFQPEQFITRAEAVTLVNHVLERACDIEFVDSNADILMQFIDMEDKHWAYYQVMEATNGHEYEMMDGMERWLSLYGVS